MTDHQDARRGTADAGESLGVDLPSATSESSTGARSTADDGDVGSTWRAGVARQARAVYESAHGNPVSDEARGVRWALTPRVAATVCLAMVIGGAVLIWTLRPPAGSVISDSANQVQVGASSDVSMSADPLSADAGNGDQWGADADQDFVIVDVAGQVASPGVRELPAGSRVVDAIEAAGGFLTDAARDTPNLARVLVDGEQVYVPELGEDASSSAVTGGAAGSRPTLININRADATALEDLPGVGPVLAERIVEFREQNGPFKSVDNLDSVSGIGPSLLEKLAEVATV